MKKPGFTLIELMAVIVIVCVMLLIGSSILFQCLKINKKTDNNIVMENKYRTIISNIEKDIKEAEVVEIYNNGRQINISNVGYGEELLYFEEKEPEKASYIYVLTQKDDESLKELHRLKVSGKNKTDAWEKDKLIEDSIVNINITQSSDFQKLMDVKVDLKIMNDVRNYVSSISKVKFIFKDEIKNELNINEFLDITTNYTLNILSNENLENNRVFSVTPKGEYLSLLAYKFVWVNGEQKLYEIRLKNNLGNEIHMTNTTIYTQGKEKESVDILGYKYPNEFKNKKSIKGPNLNIGHGKYIISYINPFAVVRNNSIYNPYNLTNEDGKKVGVSTNIGGNRLVILINGDLIISSNEHIDNAYIYCTGKIIINTKASMSITNSNLVANDGIFINDVSSLNIVGNNYGSNMFSKQEVENVLKKYTN